MTICNTPTGNGQPIALPLGQIIEAVAIAVVIVLNAAIGFATERKAASALARLRSDAVQLARVRRDGHERELPAVALVPGDVVLVAAGDRVPADGRVFEEALLEVDEATLTGESLPVSKSGDPVADRDAAIADRSSMLHMATAVTAGRGGCLITDEAVLRLPRRVSMRPSCAGAMPGGAVRDVAALFLRTVTCFAQPLRIERMFCTNLAVGGSQP